MPLTASDLYKSSSDEYNTRLQVRNRAFLTFITVATTILGVSLADPNFAFASVGISFISLVVNLLMVHHQQVMTQILLYQQLLTSQRDYDFPIWHKFNTAELERSRRSEDFAAIVIHALFNLSGLGNALLRGIVFPGVPLINIYLRWLIFGIAVVVGGYSMWLLFQMPRQRRKILLAYRYGSGSFRLPHSPLE